MPWSISTTWIRAFVRGKSKVAQYEEWKKATLVFLYKSQMLKLFAGTFGQAQMLKLG